MARAGMNIAVVFAVKKDMPLPKYHTIMGKKTARTFPVIDGDEHDFRYADYDEYPGRVIVGLRAKGFNGKADKTGFVVNVGGKNDN